MTGNPTQPMGEYGPDNGPPTGRAGSHRGRPRWPLIAVVIAGVCILVAGIAVAAFSAPGGSVGHTTAGGPAAVGPPAGGVTSTPTAPASRRHARARHPVSTTPSVSGHGIAKSALQIPDRLTKQVRRWKTGPGGKAMATVTAQMGYALQGYAVKVYAPMKLACVNLSADIRVARAAPPIPDIAMQRMYSKALTRLSGAAASCRHAISIESGEETVDAHLNAALLKRSLAGLAAGSKVLYSATAEIRAL